VVSHRTELVIRIHPAAFLGGFCFEARMNEAKIISARHEAGHAVVAHHEGVEISEVCLDSDGGKIWHDPPAALLDKGRHYNSAAMSYALIAVAGHAAAPSRPMSGSDNDSLERALWLGGLDQGYYFAFRDVLVELAAEILDHHKDRVDRVADALIERGRLSGAELEELLK
jgi:hypothetical protein